MRTGGGMAVWAILATAAWAGPASQPATRDAQGVIEIRVVDESGGASLGGAKVLVSASKTIEAFTDEKGIARFALPAGKYAVGAVGKKGYASKYDYDKRIDLPAGQTVQAVLAMHVLPPVRGVVRDAAGAPVKNVRVQLLPEDPDGGAVTDDQGRFEITVERPHGWGDSMPMLLLFRHEGRGLAGAVGVAEDSRDLQVALGPGATLAGRVTDEQGKPVPDLKATVQMASDRRYFRIDPSVLRVNDDGTYEAKSVPAGKAYIMWFEADNFGNGEVSLWPGQVQAGRVALPDVKLPPAALTVSGIVVSAAGKPLASQTVAVSGRRQRSHNTITDKDGRFVLTQIIDEVISLDAYGSTSGSVLARGGDTDVTIVAGRNLESPPPVRPLAGKALPDAGAFGLKDALAKAAGKRLLVCFCDVEGRPSRRAMRILTERAGELEKKGLAILLVHASPAPAGQAALPSGDLPAEGKLAAKALRAWGVQGLPWLILTDEHGRVTAEGFNPDAIDEAMK